MIKTSALETHRQHNCTFLKVPLEIHMGLEIRFPWKVRQALGFTAEPQDFSKFTYFTQLHDSSLGTLFVGGIASQA